MILSVSRYTARLEEQQKQEALLLAAQTEPEKTPDILPPPESEVAAGPTSPSLNSDSKFE